MVNLNLFDDLYYNKLHEYEFSGEEAAPWAVTVSLVRITRSRNGTKWISAVFIKHACLHSRQLDTDQDDVKPLSC